ncbi:uncharacterized protein SPAPADRAFT_51988 [Spathaspora passalidarum NRRL Y-27907]|uniref:Uncharacterized protein n=1 Tax=Spathaspora passalidarum (strain NRRL Y-27907 / 11-Y1) TaxID=619300 RepID=G3AT26_SPAPN|nr:uncharacterized protein SPAPADRAFT_51988 [Spathaspora passalidarum NRRL Y-27907]EGW30789.1 hypothetical protein SPAPADRAFT_51988 [Spathaspora passalidarum NRRL Y-27907]
MSANKANTPRSLLSRVWGYVRGGSNKETNKANKPEQTTNKVVRQPQQTGPSGSSSKLNRESLAELQNIAHEIGTESFRAKEHNMGKLTPSPKRIRPQESNQSIRLQNTSITSNKTPSSVTTPMSIKEINIIDLDDDVEDLFSSPLLNSKKKRKHPQTNSIQHSGKRPKQVESPQPIQTLASKPKSPSTMQVSAKSTPSSNKLKPITEKFVSHSAQSTQTQKKAPSAKTLDQAQLESLQALAKSIAQDIPTGKRQKAPSGLSSSRRALDSELKRLKDSIGSSKTAAKSGRSSSLGVYSQIPIVIDESDSDDRSIRIHGRTQAYPKRADNNLPKIPQSKQSTSKETTKKTKRSNTTQLTTPTVKAKLPKLTLRGLEELQKIAASVVYPELEHSPKPPTTAKTPFISPNSKKLVASAQTRSSPSATDSIIPKFFEQELNKSYPSTPSVQIGKKEAYRNIAAAQSDLLSKSMTPESSREKQPEISTLSRRSSLFVPNHSGEELQDDILEIELQEFQKSKEDNARSDEVKIVDVSYLSSKSPDLETLDDSFVTSTQKKRSIDEHPTPRKLRRVKDRKKKRQVVKTRNSIRVINSSNDEGDYHAEEEEDPIENSDSDFEQEMDRNKERELLTSQESILEQSQSQNNLKSKPKVKPNVTESTVGEVSRENESQKEKEAFSGLKRPPVIVDDSVDQVEISEEKSQLVTKDQIMPSQSDEDPIQASNETEEATTTTTTQDKESLPAKEKLTEPHAQVLMSSYELNEKEQVAGAESHSDIISDHTKSWMENADQEKVETRNHIPEKVEAQTQTAVQTIDKDIVASQLQTQRQSTDRSRAKEKDATATQSEIQPETDSFNTGPEDSLTRASVEVNYERSGHEVSANESTQTDQVAHNLETAIREIIRKSQETPESESSENKTGEDKVGEHDHEANLAHEIVMEPPTVGMSKQKVSPRKVTKKGSDLEEARISYGIKHVQDSDQAESELDRSAGESNKKLESHVNINETIMENGQETHSQEPSSHPPIISSPSSPQEESNQAPDKNARRYLEKMKKKFPSSYGAIMQSQELRYLSETVEDSGKKKTSMEEQCNKEGSVEEAHIEVEVEVEVSGDKQGFPEVPNNKEATVEELSNRKGFSVNAINPESTDQSHANKPEEVVETTTSQTAFVIEKSTQESEAAENPEDDQSNGSSESITVNNQPMEGAIDGNTEDEVAASGALDMMREKFPGAFGKLRVEYLIHKDGSQLNEKQVEVNDNEEDDAGNLDKGSSDVGGDFLEDEDKEVEKSENQEKDDDDEEEVDSQEDDEEETQDKEEEKEKESASWGKTPGFDLTSGIIMLDDTDDEPEQEPEEDIFGTISSTKTVTKKGYKKSKQKNRLSSKKTRKPTRVEETKSEEQQEQQESNEPEQDIETASENSNRNEETPRRTRSLRSKEVDISTSQKPKQTPQSQETTTATPRRLLRSAVAAQETSTPRRHLRSAGAVQESETRKSLSDSEVDVEDSSKVTTRTRSSKNTTTKTKEKEQPSAITPRKNLRSAAPIESEDDSDIEIISIVEVSKNYTRAQRDEANPVKFEKANKASDLGRTVTYDEIQLDLVTNVVDFDSQGNQLSTCTKCKTNKVEKLEDEICANCKKTNRTKRRKSKFADVEIPVQIRRSQRLNPSEESSPRLTRSRGDNYFDTSQVPDRWPSAEDSIRRR